MSKASAVRGHPPGRLKLSVAALDGLALLGRFFLVGGACAGVIGAFAGLIVGLMVYVPTAPVAVIELAVPAAIIGAVLGLLAGAIVLAKRRIRRLLSRGR